MKCEQCGCEFETKRSNKRFCSEKCRLTYYSEDDLWQVKKRFYHRMYYCLHREKIMEQTKRRAVLGGKK